MRRRPLVFVIVCALGCGADDDAGPPPISKNPAAAGPASAKAPAVAVPKPRPEQLTPELKAKLTANVRKAIDARQYNEALRDLAALRELFGPQEAWDAFEQSGAYGDDVGNRAWGIGKVAGLMVKDNRESEQLVVQGLARYARDEESRLRADALRQLGRLVADNRIPAAAAIPVFVELAAHEQPATRQAAISELGDLAEPKRDQTADQHGGVHPLSSTAAVPTLLKALDDPDSGVRSKAARALGEVAANDLSLAEQILRQLPEKLVHEPADDTPRARSLAARAKSSALSALEAVVAGLEKAADQFQQTPTPPAARRFDAVQTALQTLQPIVSGLQSHKDQSLRTQARRVQPKLEALAAR